jgi:hypothetical protein
MAVSALLSGIVAALACVIAHGASDAPLARDIPASVFVGLTGGAAYAAYFSMGSAIRSGVYRVFFLAADFIVGAAGGVGAVFTPRGHVTSLLGGPLCAELPRVASSVALVVLAAAYVALTLVVARRPSRRGR